MCAANSPARPGGQLRLRRGLRLRAAGAVGDWRPAGVPAPAWHRRPGGSGRRCRRGSALLRLRDAVRDSQSAQEDSTDRRAGSAAAPRRRRRRRAATPTGPGAAHRTRRCGADRPLTSRASPSGPLAAACLVSGAGRLAPPPARRPAAAAGRRASPRRPQRATGGGHVLGVKPLEFASARRTDRTTVAETAAGCEAGAARQVRATPPTPHKGSPNASRWRSPGLS